MRIIRHIASYLLLLPLFMTSCVRENWPEAGGTEGWVIPFGAAPSADVFVSTKSTMTHSASENVVYNLYVMVFDKNGNKVSGVYLDQDRIGSDEDNHWEYASAEDRTAGTIHLKSSKSSEEYGTDCTIVAISNLDAEMVNITEKQLDNIGSLTELRKISAELLQPITSRSGYFPMCGILTGVNLYGENPTTQKKDKIEFTNGSTLALERLDTKIHFNVRAEKACGIYDFRPLTWQVVNLPRYSAILPGGTVNIPEDGTMADLFFNGNENNFETETLLDENGQYDTNTGSQNGKIIPTHGFSFYMMENSKAPDKAEKPEHKDGDNETILDEDGQPAWTYQDRDLARKDENKHTEKDENGFPIFKYANDWATYVILKGQLVLEDADGAVNHAEVTYYIHLGDFGNGSVKKKLADFDILRNHSYTYDIVIEGVESIRAEVKTDIEGEPGAMGKILVPVREIFTCDSHYSTHSLVFNHSDIQSGHLGWWVRTPFNKGGKHSNADGSLPDNVNLDYKWVEFRVNFDKRNTDSGKTYKANTWTVYQPHGPDPVSPSDYQYVVNPVDGHPSPTMYIDELMDFLAAAEEGSVTIPNGGKSIFDGAGKIAVTAFVNEYYYESNPTGEWPEGWTAEQIEQAKKRLWTLFVNQPMRTMCILSASGQQSSDGESLEEKATYIIQQHSIQSVYNIDNQDINIGWGAEYMTDARELLCNRGKSSRDAYSPNSSEKRGNTDPNNGRWDTFIEWGLIKTTDTADPQPYYGDGMNWGDYVNLTEDNNSKPFMTNNYKYLRYACMSRNRDNDGDGKIDKDEVRWYMAASYQLINLYLGSYGIDSEAALYQRTAEERAVNAESSWRHHIVGSDVATFGDSAQESDKNCRVIWAEEGPTGSWLSKGQSSARITVRCVRNFGNYGDEDVTYSPESVAPDPLIIMKQIYKDPDTGAEREYVENDWSDWNSYKDVYLDFDCSRLNKKSLRYYTDRELAPHDEFNEAACLYKHFQTATISDSHIWTPFKNVSQINSDIDSNISNQWCPDGYRLPNVRELGVLCYFFDNSEVFVKSDPTKPGLNNKHYTFARTSLSFGAADLQYSGESNKWGWAVGNDSYYRAVAARIDGDYHKSYSIRCVKDIKVD